MELPNFLTQTFQKAGLADNEEIKKILSNEILKQISIDDALANTANENIISMQDATKHPKVSAHYKQSFYGTIDGVLENNLREQGFSDDEIAELRKLKTEERLASSLKKAIEKAKASNTKGQSEEIKTLQQRLQDLQKNYEDVQTSHKTELEKTNAKFSEMQLGFALSGEISKHKYHSTLTPQDADTLIKMRVNQALKEKDAVIKLDEFGNLSLKSAKDPNSDYFGANNRPLPFKDFFDEVLAKSGQLQLQEPANPNNPKPIIPNGYKNPALAHIENNK